MVPRFFLRQKDSGKDVFFAKNCPRRAELFQVCKERAYAISPYETWRKSLGLGLSSNPFHPGSKTKSGHYSRFFFIPLNPLIHGLGYL